MPRSSSIRLSPKLYALTIAGGLAFWATTVATSLLPIAAKYRAAYADWSMRTVWVASLFIGMLIAYGVSFFSLRSLAESPTKDPLTTALALSLVALVIATLVIDVPMTLQGPSGAASFFLIGLAFNAARFLVLGTAIGHAYKRQYGHARRALPY